MRQSTTRVDGFARDLLLPKLISGAIEVGRAEAAVAALDVLGPVDLARQRQRLADDHHLAQLG